MRKILGLLAAILLLQATTQAQTTIKDENVELRQVSGFTGVEVSGGFDVYLTKGTEESVGVSASKNEYIKDITVKVVNGVLHIDLKAKSKYWNTRNMRLRAYISYKALNSLTLHGATDAQLMDTWKTGTAGILLSGASDLKGDVEFEEARINQSGASDARLTGKIQNLKIDASGASNFKGYDLAIQYCEAEASGASDIRITVQKELSVRASGASDIYYRGDAMIRELKASGASTVAKR